MDKLVNKIIIRCKTEQEFIDAQRYLFQFGFEWWYCKNHQLKKYVIVEWSEYASEVHLIAELDTKWLSASCYREAVGHSQESISLAELKKIKLLNNTTKIMNTIQTLIKKLSRTEPEKTFVDVGFLNENEEITDDGKEALITILWNKNKAELKELADKLNEATKTNR
jgi:hypothetical protein